MNIIVVVSFILVTAFQIFNSSTLQLALFFISDFSFRQKQLNKQHTHGLRNLGVYLQVSFLQVYLNDKNGESATIISTSPQRSAVTAPILLPHRTTLYFKFLKCSTTVLVCQASLTPKVMVSSIQLSPHAKKSKEARLNPSGIYGNNCVDYNLFDALLCKYSITYFLTELLKILKFIYLLLCSIVISYLTNFVVSLKNSLVPKSLSRYILRGGLTILSTSIFHLFLKSADSAQFIFCYIQHQNSNHINRQMCIFFPFIKFSVFLIFQMELSKTDDKTQYTELSRKTEEQDKRTEVKKIARMVNGHEVAKTFDRFLTIQKSYCLSLGIQLFLTVLYYQLDFIGQEQKSNIILCCLNFSALPSILLGIFSQFSYNDLKTSQMKDLQILSPQQLVLGCVIILIQPYRMLQDITINNYDMRNLADVQYKLNYVLVLGSLLKLSLLIPCLINMLKFKNPRTSRICKIYSCPNSYLYTIKCCFKLYPITLVSINFVVSFLVFSFAYRVGQRNNVGFAERFNYFQNTIWLVIITMTAVGFGDISPQTIIGRLVGFICTFCGVMTVSIMLLVVINTFELDQNENKSLRILKKLQQKKQIKVISAQYLRLSLWRIWRNYKKSKQSGFEMQPESKDEKLLRKTLRQRIRLSKFNDSSVTDLGLEMNRQFQKIQYNVQNLMENSDQILNYLSNNYFINLEEIKEDSKAMTGFNYG